MSDSDDDDGGLLSQLINSQTYEESSQVCHLSVAHLVGSFFIVLFQNIDAAYAILESHKQRAQLEAVNQDVSEEINANYTNTMYHLMILPLD